MKNALLCSLALTAITTLSPLAFAQVHTAPTAAPAHEAKAKKHHKPVEGSAAEEKKETPAQEAKEQKAMKHHKAAEEKKETPAEEAKG